MKGEKEGNVSVDWQKGLVMVDGESGGGEKGKSCLWDQQKQKEKTKANGDEL